MPAEPVGLAAVARAVGAAYAGPDVAVSDVHHDSRAVTPGSVFVAIRGEKADGHAFVGPAVAAGAAAVIVEQAMGAGVPELVVDDTRVALARAAAVVHGDPSAALRVVGVTGTNGKTSVTHMIEAIAAHNGLPAGLIGTLGARIAGTAVPLERTTPESSDVQRLLARMLAAGTDVVAIEVSSHALALHRADGVHFEVVAFTNLSRDHLDFHGDMESYFAAKARLFASPRAGKAVIWVDDAWGRRLARSVRGDGVTTVGLDATSDVSAGAVVSTARGSSFRLSAPGHDAAVRIPVAARFNVANALVAAAVCLELEIPFAGVVSALERLPQVPGRFELVPGPWPFSLIVDYAHTPDAVSTAIRDARAISDGRVIAVVGAGGDRDREKRPLMGAAAARADVTVITSDNPRSEVPADIIAAVVGGIADRSSLVVEEDRRLAIHQAVSAAGRGDVVLVLGKGHEQGQDFGHGRVEPFDDRVVARAEAEQVTAGAGR